jgi:conjugative relaxase-like TrwC/TraI family protein
MLTGNDPASGEPLGLRSAPGREPVPGFDLTFSAPKSASLLWALGDPGVAGEVSRAHQRSVEAALDYMQHNACWARRGAGGAEFVPGNGYLAAAYRHRSSRNCDPQLHTHVLIANATKGPDGRWSRLYHPAIYEHAKTAGYLYEVQLRHELTLSLGVRWQEVRNGIAEIEGFRDEHLRAFSTRRAEILEAVGPLTSARARQVAALATRGAKERDISREGLRERWASKARAIGLDREAIEATLAIDGTLTIRSAEAEITSAQLGRELTAHASHFDRRDAIQAVAQLSPEGAPAREVEQAADAYLASEAVIRVAENAKADRYTTLHIWELEGEALAAAKRMAGEPRGRAGDLVAARAIKARPTLKPDQREMVQRLLSGREGIVVVVGEAGTGKTYAIVAAAEGWAAAGFELRAVAPTWRAANALRREGLDATTVAGLLAELDRQTSYSAPILGERSVLLVDEAGMVGSVDLAKLIGHVEEAGAKLVFVGDYGQLPEIEAGGLFRALAERGEPIRLEEVIRHNHELDREAAKRIREGEGREAFELYRSAERVTVAPDAEARRGAMVADWWRSAREGEDALMVAQRNVEVARLNATARELMRSEGRLGAEEIEVGGARFAAGDQVITRINDRANDIYNRERWQIAEVNAEKQSVVLEGVDQARRVEVGPEYLARTNPYGEAPALQHAYAVTTYCAQGATVDRAYVMADPSMDKQALYVAASRSREETYLYATPEVESVREEFAPTSPDQREGIDHLAEAAVRDRSQTAAHEEALRDELRRLPSQDLAARQEALSEPLHQEARLAEVHADRQKWLEMAQGRYEYAVAQREAAEELGWRERRRALPRALEREEDAREVLDSQLAKMDGLEPLRGEARREAGAIREVLAQREELALTAIRLSPPRYIVKELGERPSDLEKGRAWDRGVKEIEGYRQGHGITDKRRTFGREPQSLSQQAARETAQRNVREAQRRLGRERRLARERKLRRSIERGLSLGR